jgi:hypothetical protein
VFGGGPVNTGVMRLSHSIKALLLPTLLFLAPLVFPRPNAGAEPDVFWLDRYGNIAWDDEKARLDNFARNLLKINGGADGTRTRDLRRDRPAF